MSCLLCASRLAEEVFHDELFVVCESIAELVFLSNTFVAVRIGRTSFLSNTFVAVRIGSAFAQTVLPCRVLSTQTVLALISERLSRRQMYNITEPSKIAFHAVQAMLNSCLEKPTEHGPAVSSREPAIQPHDCST